MNDGIKQENIKQYLSAFTNNIDEKNYVYCQIKPVTIISWITNILRFGQASIMYFSENEIVFLHLNRMGNYVGNTTIIPYEDINHFDRVSFAAIHLMLIKCNVNKDMSITIPKLLLGGKWQSENLKNLLDNDFYKDIWQKNS
ncbi:hypothetical protein I2494_00455 [Budviciaceae bacterium BWR-B9]|uniref:Uncharacterized protein n=1 Tax=Limnobaculum allomyrinae TaxID=2791986 RepID=A0ABS1IKG4_9GAMM|nr:MULTISPECIES: hypothetical protein [Limnobaculum]MBK5142202.1 hypothetical protein [Limnobaculum allomyrinae]MBV7690914.1 hypothetical protein [Limnobaculum sp. M2-1]